jgi:hypothetical protein
MSDVKYYPLDFARLTKGTVIERDEVEQITGYAASHPQFNLKLLQLRNKCNAELRKRGVVLTICTSHGALIVCDDAAAAKYNHKQGRSGLRRFGRSHARNLHVDMAMLSVDERTAHERTLIRNGRMLSAIRISRRAELTVTPTERKTPALPAPKETP